MNDKDKAKQVIEQARKDALIVLADAEIKAHALLEEQTTEAEKRIRDTVEQIKVQLGIDIGGSRAKELECQMKTLQIIDEQRKISNQLYATMSIQKVVIAIGMLVLTAFVTSLIALVIKK